MTVPNDFNTKTYELNGSATQFDTEFQFFDESQLNVYLVTEDEATPLILGTDYSVSGVGNPSGGTVTYPISGAPGDNGNLLIERVLPIVQETSFRNQGAYYPETVERAIDESRMIDQQLQDGLEHRMSRGRGERGWDAEGRRILNVGDAQRPMDAVNLRVLQQLISGIESGEVGDASLVTALGTADTRSLSQWMRDIWYPITSTGEQSLTDALNSRVIYVDSAADLLALNANDLLEGQVVYVASMVSGNDAGGGQFVWNGLRGKDEHDGGYVIDPEHTQLVGSDAWYSPENSGTGVFVRNSNSDEVYIEEYAASESSDIHFPLVKAHERANGGVVKAFPGKVYPLERGVHFGEIQLDFNDSTLLSSVPDVAVSVGNYLTAKSQTTLSSNYSPFTGQTKVLLSSVEGIEVGDIISIVTSDIFHPNREHVYKRGIASIVSLVEPDGVYIQDEIPYSLTASTSRVIVLEPSQSSITNINFVGNEDPSQTAIALNLSGLSNSIIENVSTDLFGTAGVSLYHSVGTDIRRVRTKRSYWSGTNQSYGLVVRSVTRTHVDNLETYTGRHGFATGANANYLPGIASGDDRGCPVVGLLITNSNIFPEVGIAPPADGNNSGLDCHEGTYDVTVKDSVFYKFQFFANFVTVKDCKIFGNSGTHSLLCPIPDGMNGAVLFENVVWEGNGRIRFKGLQSGSSYTGGLRFPSIKFINCRNAMGTVFLFNPQRVIGSGQIVIEELVLDGTYGMHVRDHDLSQVTINRLALHNIKDRQRGHYRYINSGSRIDTFEVIDCEWEAGYQCLQADPARRLVIRNLYFYENTGSFTASLSNDAYVFLQNVRLNWQSGPSIGVEIIDRGGSGSIYRLAAPLTPMTSGATLGSFAVNQSQWS